MDSPNLIAICKPMLLLALTACILQDYETGGGMPPDDGQEVEFHYSAYNENGSRIDSSFSKGKPAKTRMGIKGLIPGLQSFEQVMGNVAGRGGVTAGKIMCV